MLYSKPIMEVIRQRFSCRTYFEKPVEEYKRQRLIEFMSSNSTGPLGTPVRLKLIAATEQDRSSLKGLGTYGIIKGATGFIVGAVRNSKKNLEDYGYLMERAILYATDIGLGTCWLGGTFTRSRFAKKISAAAGETVPAVVSIGYIAEMGRFEGKMRQFVGSQNRHPWKDLFFEKKFGVLLSPEDAGTYVTPLEMVRIGPSASNKQPWRIVKDGNTWHFYLHRTKGYGNSLTFKFLRLADLQRVDMGIAMSHFELTANEIGLKGKWIVREPQVKKPDSLTEYTVSWYGEE
ncbi:MAG TPA: nitroreductase family protein [Syntrophales bacterium]|nr:nitroreductase family protein [Syntrophales bacterium]